MKTIKCIVIFFLLVSMGLAQETTKMVAPRFTMRFNCGIPKITSSNLFRNSFTGVVVVDGSLNIKLFSNVFAGVGYGYAYYKTQKSLSDLGVNTNMQLQNGFVKLGYDKYLSDNQFVSMSLNTGYNYSFYQGIKYPNDSLKGKYPTSFSSGYIEPQFGFYFINDDNIALGINLSYYYSLSKFDVRYPVIDKWLTNANSLSNKWNMSAINISLGIYYGIGK